MRSTVRHRPTLFVEDGRHMPQTAQFDGLGHQLAKLMEVDRLEQVLEAPRFIASMAVSVVGRPS